MTYFAVEVQFPRKLPWQPLLYTMLESDARNYVARNAKRDRAEFRIVSHEGEWPYSFDEQIHPTLWLTEGKLWTEVRQDDLAYISGA